MMFSEKLYLHGTSPMFLMKNVYLKKFKFLIVPSSLYAVAPKFRSVASVSIFSSPMSLKLLYVYSWNSGNDSVFKNDVGTVNASSRESVSSTFPVSSDTLNVPTNRPKKAMILNDETTTVETPPISSTNLLLLRFFTYSSSYISVCVLEGGAR